MGAKEAVDHGVDERQIVHWRFKPTIWSPALQPGIGTNPESTGIVIQHAPEQLILQATFLTVDMNGSITDSDQ